MVNRYWVKYYTRNLPVILLAGCPDWQRRVARGIAQEHQRGTVGAGEALWLAYRRIERRW